MTRKVQHLLQDQESQHDWQYFHKLCLEKLLQSCKKHPEELELVDCPYQHHYYQVQNASMESTELKPHHLELELVAVESWVHCQFSEVDYQKSLYSQCLLHLQYP